MKKQANLFSSIFNIIKEGKKCCNIIKKIDFNTNNGKLSFHKIYFFSVTSYLRIVLHKANQNLAIEVLFAN